MSLSKADFRNKMRLMKIFKKTKFFMNCPPSEAQFPAVCCYCGRPANNLNKYTYPLYYKAPLRERLGAFEGALIFWAMIVLFSLPGLLAGFSFSLFILAWIIIFCIFMTIATAFYLHDSEKFSQPKEFLSLSIPVCQACDKAAASKKELWMWLVGVLLMIVAPFIFLLAEDVSRTTIIASWGCGIFGLFLLIYAYIKSSRFKALKTWKCDNGYVWIIRNPAFAEEFIALNRNTNVSQLLESEIV